MIFASQFPRIKRSYNFNARLLRAPTTTSCTAEKINGANC
jgi:hypothetical protein